MARQWYYQADGQIAGPLRSSELQAKVTEGVILPDTLIRPGKDGKWIRASRVKGLLAPSPPSGTAQSTSTQPSPSPLSRPNDPTRQQLNSADSTVPEAVRSLPAAETQRLADKAREILQPYLFSIPHLRLPRGILTS